MLYTSVSDVLNTVSKGRRSILTSHSITSAVKSLVHALTATSCVYIRICIIYTTTTAIMEILGNGSSWCYVSIAKYRGRMFGIFLMIEMSANLKAECQYLSLNIFFLNSFCKRFFQRVLKPNITDALI